MKYLALVAIVFGINLLPAFGPPTWALLVFARLRWRLDPVALVILGAGAAMAGRYVLALTARHFKGRLPERLRGNVEVAREALLRRRLGTLAFFALFVVSPLPSAQLFLAAGLLDLELVPLTLAFFLGRIVSYSLYVAAATLAEVHFQDVIGKVFGSPWSIALQLVFLVAVCLLPFVNWKRFDQTSSRSS